MGQFSFLGELSL